MAKYLTYGEPENGRAKIHGRYMNPFDGLEEMEPNGFYADEIPEPETPEGFEPVLMAELPAEGGDEEPTLYYDYFAIPEPEETQLQKLQKQVEMLTARAATLGTGQEMQEDVITEIVMHVYE